MTDLRDKIAAVIVSNRACDNWHEPRPADLELADAIIAALQVMAAPQPMRTTPPQSSRHLQGESQND